MFMVLVWFNNVPSPWGLIYNDETRAKQALENLVTGDSKFLTFADDFGQSLIFDREHIRGVAVKDLKKSGIADVELNLHQARIQSQFQTRAQSDPTLRMNGPPVISPMGMQPFRN